MDFLGLLHPHGVFLRREALACGVDERALSAALADGTLARVRHGAYTDSRAWSGAGDRRRHVLRAHAVALSHGRPMAISHVSGAVMHGAQVWNVDLERVDVARPVDTGGRRYRDISYHQRHIDDVATIDGSPVLPAADCVADAASHMGVEEGVVLIDSAYNNGLCAPEDLKAAYDKRIGWPGTARLRVTLPLAQVGSQSVGESRLRYLFWRQGVPRPVLQFPIESQGRVIAHSDFAWPDLGLLGEFDGKVKYQALLREGESPSDAVFREKVREDQIREATGWTVIRFTWADLSKPAQVRARVRKAMRLDP